MMKISIFCRSKLPKTEEKTAKLSPNVPKSHLGVSNDQNLHFLCAKIVFFFYVLSEIPPNIIWGSNEQNVDLLWVTNANKIKKKK